jgi:branched-chain amino acid transport system substrate-binding protein
MIKKRLYVLAGIASVTVLAFLAGCGKGSDPNANAKQQSKSVRVAAILPLTGPAASLGEDAKFGMDMAYRDFQGATGLVSFSYEDSQSKPETTISALRKQLDVNGTRVFVIATTAPVQAALPALRDAKLDVLAFVSATMPDVAAGYPFAYRIYPTASEEVATLAEYATKKGLKAIAALAPRNRVGEESLTMLAAQLEPHGASVLLAETFDMTQKDFRSLLAKIKAAKIDAVCLTGCFPSQYAPILNQMIEAGITVPVLCGLGMVTAGVEKDLPMEFLGRLAFVAPPFYFNPDKAATSKFMKDVQARGKVPNYDIGYAYDTTALFLRAVETAHTGNPKDIIAAMENLLPYEGVTGSLTFNQNRDAVLGLRACRWVHGRITLAE